MTDHARFILDLTSELGALTMRSIEHLSETDAWLELGFDSPEALHEAIREGAQAKLPKALRRPVVMQLVAEGMSQRQIAEALGVSHETVRRDIGTHVTPDDGDRAQDGQDGGTHVTPDPLAVHYSSESPEWYTPAHIVEAVVEVLGTIDLDPCADPGKAIPAVRHFTAEDDGLSQPWSGRVYMNPPYGREIVVWVEKLADEYNSGRVSAAIALVPARVDTAWWRALPHRDWLAVSGRLAFSEHENAAPFPSAVCYLGPDAARFRRVFSALGDGYARWEGVA